VEGVSWRMCRRTDGQGKAGDKERLTKLLRAQDEIGVNGIVKD